MIKILIKTMLFVLFLACFSVTDGFSQDKGKNNKKDAKKDKGKDDDNKLVGIRWEVEINDGGSVETAKFRATPNYKVFMGSMEMGTWAKFSGEKIKVVITMGKLKGEMELVQILNKPPTFGGKLKKADGSEAKVKILFLKD